MRVAAVVVDTRVREIGVDDGPECLRKLVGGNVERLAVGEGIVGYLNAEADELPANPLADRLLSQLGVGIVDGVRGTLVLLGVSGGGHADTPGIVRDIARRLQ